MLHPLNPAEARRAMADGAQLIDVRAADEHAREHIPGALCLPLGAAALPPGDAPVIFHCRSGARTAGQAGALATLAGDRPAFVLAGGIEAWRKAGLPTAEDRRQPLPIMRQVQIAAGLLVLTGVILGLFLDPRFFALAGFVGAGLTFAGATGWCGMAHMLERMPWNRRPVLA